MARLIPRGTVFDRAGIPLATDDPSLVHSEVEAYERMRISARELCPKPGDRCYPLGGHAFHVLGDAQTRTNWAASNSSYVERDAQDRLRGFDDRAASVRTSGAGEESVALRRDYTPLVPLVRHRWEPEHPEVKAVFDAPAVSGRRNSFAFGCGRRREEGGGRHHRRGHGRCTRQRQLPVAGRSRLGRVAGLPSRSRAVRPVSAGIDVQGHHGGRGAPRGSLPQRSGLRLFTIAW
jgi:hypothetical protein